MEFDPVHSEEMLPQRLEEVVSAVLAESRASLRVARARCYAMGPAGDFRLAGSFGYVSRFGPEDVLEASHPLVEWVQRHRRPAYANSPGEAGRLAGSMEREQYARMLAAPAYVGSRMVAIVELQDKLEGAFFAAEDLRAAEKLASRVAAVLESFDGSSMAAPEPMAQEDADALYRPGSDGGSLQEFPAPPPLFSAGPEWEEAPAELQLPPAVVAAAPYRPPSPSTRPVSREELVFRGYLRIQLGAFTGRAWLAILIQAMIFGLAHAQQGAASATRIAIYGLALGVVAHSRRSVVPCILAHVATDLVSGLVH